MNKTKYQWTQKVQSIFSVCQDEIKRTTRIGTRMLSASRVNGDLKDTYEELGALVLTAMEKNELQWDNLRAQALVEKIKKSEEHLAEMEKEVQGIKAEKRNASSND